MILLWIGLGFVLGLVVAALLAATIIWRRHEAAQRDPWVNPPTPEAGRLRKAAQLHLCRYILDRSTVADSNEPIFRWGRCSPGTLPA